MRNLFNILLLLILTTFFSSAQDTIFIKSYGMVGYNYGEKIIQTNDNGYIILGNKSGFVGNTDVYLMKVNYFGALIWDKAYGGDEVNHFTGAAFMI